MYVACSTRCFASMPLENALRMINELQFSKVDVAIQENGSHLKPSEVAQDVSLAAQKIRIGPSLTPSSFHVQFDTADETTYQEQLKAICRLARLSAITTITISASPVETPMATEVARLKRLVNIAQTEGIILSLATHNGTLTENPKTAVELCREVPSLGITLDPSHYLIGPHQSESFDCVFPYVRHVHFRDTGRSAEQFQVRIGQGQVEYGRIVSSLIRLKYDRLLTVDIHDIPDSPFVMESEVRKLKYLLESLI